MRSSGGCDLRFADLPATLALGGSETQEQKARAWRRPDRLKPSTSLQRGARSGPIGRGRGGRCDSTRRSSGTKGGARRSRLGACSRLPTESHDTPEQRPLLSNAAPAESRRPASRDGTCQGAPPAAVVDSVCGFSCRLCDPGLGGQFGRPGRRWPTRSGRVCRPRRGCAGVSRGRGRRCRADRGPGRAARSRRGGARRRSSRERLAERAGVGQRARVRPSKTGRVPSVLTAASQPGLSSPTCGREWERVTPRSTSSSDDRLGGHRGAPVGVDAPPAAVHPDRLGEHRPWPVPSPPSRTTVHATTYLGRDVEHDVQVVVQPCAGPRSFVMSQDHTCPGSGEQLRDRSAAGGSPASRVSDAWSPAGSGTWSTSSTGRRSRQQRRPHLRDGLVDEPVTGQHGQHASPLRPRERVHGARRGPCSRLASRGRSTGSPALSGPTTGTPPRSRRRSATRRTSGGSPARPRRRVRALGAASPSRVRFSPRSERRPGPAELGLRLAGARRQLLICASRGSFPARPPPPHVGHLTRRSSAPPHQL